MADLNSWAITGNLTKDAEFKTLPSGKGLLECNVACNIGFGQYKKTIWIKVQQWGDYGKNIVDYLKKGIKIACSGELTTEEWESKADGKMHTNLILKVFGIQILTPKKKDEDETSEESYTGVTDPVF